MLKNIQKNIPIGLCLILCIMPTNMNFSIDDLIPFDINIEEEDTDQKEEDTDQKEEDTDQKEEDSDQKEDSTDQKEDNTDQKEDNTDQKEEDTDQKDEDGGSAENRTEESLVGEHGYYYSTLPEEMQKYYLKLYDIALQDNTENARIDVGDLSTKEMKWLYESVMGDHPEIWYIYGYCYGVNDNGITMGLAMEKGVKSKDQFQKEIDLYVDTFFLDREEKGITENSSDFDKVRYTYDYIVSNTVYNLESEMNQNICSVFVNKESVCAGYSEAFQYLLLEQGISCINVTGDAGGPHEWNCVMMDGEWYWIDVTWGDSEEFGGESVYVYFGLTDEIMGESHSPDKCYQKLPVCTAVANNYCIHEGYYLESADEDAINKIVEKAKKEGQNYVEIAFASNALMLKAKGKLSYIWDIYPYIDANTYVIGF